MNYLIQIHIADIHFGAIDPEVQFNILKEQFIDKISKIHFDILAIDGDLFDRKFIASSEVVRYAIMFVHMCASLCRDRNASLIFINGTESHEAGQLSMFEDLPLWGVDSYVVNQTTFIYSHGKKILCIPEEYGKGYDYYAPFLNQSYDFCFMHGTIVGGVYGANESNLNNRRPVFDIQDFHACRRLIISGHVHKAMCLKQHMYYVSNPIRYKFGEEDEKGFAIIISNDTHYHYQFIPITSFDYKTHCLTFYTEVDPDIVIKDLSVYISSMIEGDKIRFLIKGLKPETIVMVKQYFQPMSNIVKLEFESNENNGQPVINTVDDILEKYSDMDYMFDPKYSSFGKLSKYINGEVGYECVTPEELKSIYESK